MAYGAWVPYEIDVEYHGRIVANESRSLLKYYSIFIVFVYLWDQEEAEEQAAPRRMDAEQQETNDHERELEYQHPYIEGEHWGFIKAVLLEGCAHRDHAK